MYSHERILQLIPSAGWFGCWAIEPRGQFSHEPVVAFALVEEWRSDANERKYIDGSGCFEGQGILPVMRHGDYLATEHGDSFMGIFSAEEIRSSSDLRLIAEETYDRNKRISEAAQKRLERKDGVERI